MPLARWLFGRPEGELPTENVSNSSREGNPEIDKRPLVAEVTEAGGEFVGENGPCPNKDESGGEA